MIIAQTVITSAACSGAPADLQQLTIVSATTKNITQVKVLAN